MLIIVTTQMWILGLSYDSHNALIWGIGSAQALHYIQNPKPHAFLYRQMAKDIGRLAHSVLFSLVRIWKSSVVPRQSLMNCLAVETQLEKTIFGFARTYEGSPGKGGRRIGSVLAESCGDFQERSWHGKEHGKNWKEDLPLNANWQNVSQMASEAVLSGLNVYNSMLDKHVFAVEKQCPSGNKMW